MQSVTLAQDLALQTRDILSWTKQLILFSFLFSGVAISAQDGMIGTGFANGWNYPADVVSMEPSLGGSYLYTSQAAAVGDNYFRFTRSSDGNQLGPFNCSDTEWTGSEGISYDNMWVCNMFGAFYINAPNTTDNYVFKTRFQSDDDFLFFRIQGDVFDFIPGQTAQDPMANAENKIAPNTPVTVLTVGSPPAGQALYLRYSIDAFATSSVIQMTDPFGILAYEAVIPGQADGDTVRYYLFSSGDGANGPLADGTDADYKTITYETNGGDNFFYIVDAALPVVYRNFSANRQREGVLLNWTTDSEENADYFAVERSEDNGMNWHTCTRLLATNSAAGATYDYLDPDAPVAALQYRLRQVDADGTASYSRIVNVSALSHGVDIAVFPQPVLDRATVRTQLSNYEGASLKVIDLNGREMMRVPLRGTQQQLSLAELPRGVYVLQLWRAGQLTSTRRLVKQ